MNSKFFIGIAVLCLFVFSTEARFIFSIDVFGDSQPPLVLIASNGNDPTNSEWWSPYYVSGSGSGGEPETLFFSTSAALGGQRDCILGYESITPTNSVSVISIVGTSASVAFPLNYAGGAYFQWDGDDTGGNASAAFPGAILNVLPGIGNGEPASIDNQTLDFLQGGRSLGMFISIVTDHEVQYSLDALDSVGNVNNLPFVVPEPDNEDTATIFFFRFSDPSWSDPLFDWTDVAAFQVKIFTFEGGLAQAVDTEFQLLSVFGYEISGTVISDCLCDTTQVDPVQGELVNLFNFGSSVILQQVATDASGFFLFDSNIAEGSYSVCLDDTSRLLCPSEPFCYDITIANFNDVTGLDFTVTFDTTLSIPDDVTLECGSSTDPSNTGFASVTGCSGGTTQVNTFTDVTTGNSCLRTIRRTWTDTESGETGLQTIIVQDTQNPIITNDAQDVTQSCEDPSTYVDWIANFGFAAATDCSSVSFSASANAEPIQCDFETVTFTATDICGRSSSTTATYTVFDNTDPVFSPGASDATAECSLKTSSSDNALTTWVNTRGGAVASDNCNSVAQLFFTNDFIGFPSGCSNSEFVTFTVTDRCGNFDTTSATFTIEDTTNPTITTQASDMSAQCSKTGSDVTAFNNWLSSRAGAVATDACISNDNNLVWTNNFSGPFGGADSCFDTAFVTFTVLDNCGFTSSTSATFTIEDTLNPFFTTNPQDDTAQCDGSGNVSDFNNWVSTNAGAVGSDACSTSVTISNNASAGPTLCGEDVSVDFTVSDGCGFSVTRSATFTIVDNVAPFFVNFPSDFTSECSSSTQDDFDTWLGNDAFATASDACSTAGLVINNNYNGNPINVFCGNSITVQFNVLDTCGNFSPNSAATFSIVDTVDPTFTSFAADMTVECNLTTNQNSYQAWLASNGGAAATDSCGTVSFSNDRTSITSTCFDQDFVTFTASDGCGNSVTTSATFTVEDTTFPTLNTAASDMTVECNGSGNTNDLNNWLNSRGGAVASDSCSQVTWTNDFVALSGGCVSSAFVTFTGCDACSQCIDTSATFTVEDTRGPAINPQAQDAFVECDPTSNDNAFQDYLDNNGGAIANDACNNSGLVWTNAFITSPSGCDSEEVTFTVTDPCGFSASTTATFTIVDSVDPVFSPPPSDMTVECDGSGNVSEYNNWVNTFAGADATDACATFLTFEIDAAANGPVGCGTETALVTVEDECLNAVSRNARFIVVDNQDPIFTTLPDDLDLECNTSTNLQDIQTYLNNNGGAVASDSCYGSNVNIVNNFVRLNIVDDCTSNAIVNFVASDPCGRSATTSATITVTDTAAPAILVGAGAGFFECDTTTQNDILNFISNNGGAVAQDACSPIVWSNDFVSSPDECNGPIPVTFTVMDVCGNMATSIGSVEIDDTIAPQLTNFPSDRIILCDDSSDPSQTGRPGGFDACDSDVDITFFDNQEQEPDFRFCPGDVIITRTWTATDDCGNFNQRDQTITVTIPIGDCTPTPCPPCDDFVCCESSVEAVACNPVGCNPVPCATTECESVPCLPVVCEPGAPPIYNDDDDDYVIPPSPAPQAPQCDPVYIYVFDDDEYVQRQVYQPEESTSSSSIVSVSVFITLLSVIATLLF